MRIALSNLVDNAVKHARPGEITLSAHSPAPGLLALAVGCIGWLLRRARRQETQAWQHSVARSEALQHRATAMAAQIMAKPIPPSDLATVLFSRHRSD